MKKTTLPLDQNIFSCDALWVVGGGCGVRVAVMEVFTTRTSGTPGQQFLLSVSFQLVSSLHHMTRTCDLNPLFAPH